MRPDSEASQHELSCPPSSSGELGRLPDGSGLDVRADKIGRPAVSGLRTCRRWSGGHRQWRSAPSRGTASHWHANERRVMPPLWRFGPFAAKILIASGNVDRVGPSPIIPVCQPPPDQSEISSDPLTWGPAWRAIRAYRFFRNPQASDAAQCDVAANGATRHRC